MRLIQEVFQWFLFLGLFFEMECFDLTLLHVNDIHSRISQTNERSGVCKQKDEGKTLNFFFFKKNSRRPNSSDSLMNAEVLYG